MALAPACADVRLCSLESRVPGLHTDCPPGAEVLQRPPMVRPLLNTACTTNSRYSAACIEVYLRLMILLVSGGEKTGSCSSSSNSLGLPP